MKLKKVIALILTVLTVTVISIGSILAAETPQDSLIGGGGGRTSSEQGLSDEDVARIRDSILGTEEETEPGQSTLGRGQKHDRITDEIQQSIGWGFGTLRKIITNSDENFYSISSRKLTQEMLKIFLPLGFIVMIISWCVGIGKKTVTMELFEVKDFIRSGLGLVVAMLFITATDAVLLLILEIVDNISLQILHLNDTDTSILFYLKYANYDVFKSNIPIIGPLINSIDYILIQLHMFLNSFMLMIVCIIVNIQLAIRMIKLCIFRGVAPVFFGMMAGEETKKHAESFILEFIITAANLIMLAVFFTMFQITWATLYLPYIDNTGDFNTTGLLYGSVIAITFCVMCCKSEGFLRKMLHR